jgi:hypothetical protein
MVHKENTTVTGERVKLDGNSYVNVTFERCIMEYHGTASVKLQDCKFVACRWAFDGPAGNTIRFMSAIYQNGDPTLQKLIDDTFGSIRTGKIPVIPTAEQAAKMAADKAAGKGAKAPTPIKKS